MSPVYLDCNATTPLDPEVREVLFHYLTEEFGNEGSRTHEYGARAKQAVQQSLARERSLQDRLSRLSPQPPPHSHTHHHHPRRGYRSVNKLKVCLMLESS
jgi:hypothetical protein